jgi:hypothetical protein
MLKYPHLERINHIHHAGNSSGIVDGAAAVLIGNAEFGRAHGLKPRARIRATAKIGTDPTIMLTGPVPVTEKILKDHGMAISDIDLFEVNEAFASVPVSWLKDTGADPDRLNVHGGAIALGHPLGGSGAGTCTASLACSTLLSSMSMPGKLTVGDSVTWNDAATLLKVGNTCGVPSLRYRSSRGSIGSVPAPRARW